MKTIFRLTLAIILICGGYISSSAREFDFKIITGQFEKGSTEQKDAFIQLFGSENTQEKFDLYFHWYNIAHEYGHCLLDYYGKGIGKVQEELLVNRFAVAYWKYAGYSDELEELKSLLEDVLKSFPNPVPEGKSLVDWYTEIWGSDLLVSVPVYGYLQFKGVLLAMDEDESLKEWLDGVGINTGSSDHIARTYYPLQAESAIHYLEDLQNNLKGLGLKIPSAEVELIDNPSTHCAQKL